MAYPLPRLLCWIVELIAFIKGASLFVGTAFAVDSAEAEKSILVLCGERGDLPAIQAFEENLREVFHSSRSPRIELFCEYLDFARFSGDQQKKTLLRYLHERYARRRIDVVRDVARVARAPVYGLLSQFLGTGVVGGAMFDFGLNGRKTAEMVLKALRGQWVPYGTLETQSQNPLLINWPALKKASLSGQPLPAGAEVRLRKPGLWETHRIFILVLLGALLFQTILIAGFILERLSRRRAESSLRQSEERMSLVADRVNFGMEMWDTAKDEVWMTERGRALFGIDGETDLKSATIVARIHPDDRAVRDASIRQAIQTRGEYSAEYRVMLPDGTIRWIGARGRPMGSGNGKVTRLLGISVDISERKQAEAESRQYQEELAHLSRVEIVAEMATALAHELNQPLAGIMNNASAGRRFIAKGRADMPKLDHLLDAVLMDARRAAEIIRGIRAMVRKGEGARISVNLNSIITDVVRFVHSDALERHCTVLSELDPDLPPVNANQILIQQVLINLLINAFDAMRQTPAAERRVIISSRRSGCDKVCVSVRDYGTGLPTETPDQIFEPFFSTKQNGLGMGLSIARSIISSHGGELAAENAEGRGACIHFSLPAVEEDWE